MTEVLGDPVSMRFYPYPFSRDETWAWIERNRARFDAIGLGLWAVVLRATAVDRRPAPGRHPSRVR